jgi:hypothetical protein
MNTKSDHEERNRPTAGSENFETVIIGGGQAGLSVGYHLKKQGRPFVILDANERIGDAWRNRWDSLRLFTPARYSGLTGWRFPAPAVSFPTKEEMADYLESYAARFDLPVRTGFKVDARAAPRVCSLPVISGLVPSLVAIPSRNSLMPEPKPLASSGIRLAPKSNKIITSTMIR